MRSLAGVKLEVEKLRSGISHQSHKGAPVLEFLCEHQIPQKSRDGVSGRASLCHPVGSEASTDDNYANFVEYEPCDPPLRSERSYLSS